MITTRLVARSQAMLGKWPSGGWWRGLKHRFGVTEIQGFHIQLQKLGTAPLSEGAICMIIKRIVQCTTCTALHGRRALRMNRVYMGLLLG